jgi:hypothetical protein
VVTIVLELISPQHKWWHDLMLLTLRCYALNDHVLSDVIDMSTYWARLDNIVLTWILGTLSIKLHEIVHEPLETARQAWLIVEAHFQDNHESHALQIDAKFCVFKQGDLASMTIVTR